MGWSVGRGCPLPTEEGVWGGGCAPSPEIKKKILVQCVQKIFVFRPKGGASPSAPLNTPLVLVVTATVSLGLPILTFFSNLIVNLWNDLPSSTTDFTSFRKFDKSLNNDYFLLYGKLNFK